MMTALNTVCRLAVVLSLCAVPVAAQPAAICRTFVVPDQGRDPTTGNNSRNAGVLIPNGGLTGIYPVVIEMPKHAASLGIEFWSHNFGWLGLDVPPGRVLLGAFVDRGDRRPADNAPFIQWYDDGKPRNDNLSLRLAPGEVYIIGAWNFGPAPITISLMVTYSICFQTQDEMNSYKAQIETP